MTQDEVDLSQVVNKKAQVVQDLLQYYIRVVHIQYIDYIKEKVVPLKQDLLQAEIQGSLISDAAICQIRMLENVLKPDHEMDGIFDNKSQSKQPIESKNTTAAWAADDYKL